MKPIIPSFIAFPAAITSRSRTAAFFGILVLAFGFLPNAAHTEDARVTKSMAALKEQTAKLGAPKVEGQDAVGGKDAPALYFGSTKMNNTVAVVDAVAKEGAKEGGVGMAATLFVKSGEEYVRVATTVMNPDKKGRALGTVLDAGPALDAIKAGKAYYGEVTVLGKTYIGGYEPIKDASGAIIGIYFVGRQKRPGGEAR